MGHNDNSPVPYLGTLPPSLTAVMREQQMDAIRETAFNDQTGDWAPISNWTQQTLTLKGQLPDIRAKMESHFVPLFSPLFFPHSFFFFSSTLLWRLFSPLSVWKEQMRETALSLWGDFFFSLSVQV